ncbi:hypothetical protein [Streptomyces sp. NPDC054829]
MYRRTAGGAASAISAALHAGVPATGWVTGQAASAGTRRLLDSFAAE